MDFTLNIGHLISGAISLAAVFIAYLSYKSKKDNKATEENCHIQTDVTILKTKVESMEKFLEKLENKLDDIKDNL